MSSQFFNVHLAMSKSWSPDAGARHLSAIVQQLKSQLSRRPLRRSRASTTADHAGNLAEGLGLGMRTASLTDLRPPELTGYQLTTTSTEPTLCGPLLNTAFD